MKVTKKLATPLFLDAGGIAHSRNYPFCGLAGIIGSEAKVIDQSGNYHYKESGGVRPYVNFFAKPGLPPPRE